MRKIGQGLYDFCQPWFCALKQHYGKQYGRRNADKQFAETVKKGVPQQFGKIKRFNEGAEMFKANPLASQNTVKGHKILERNLSVPDRAVPENDEISDGQNQKDVNGTVPLDFPPFI
jgi:hypothetical protein